MRSIRACCPAVVAVALMLPDVARADEPVRPPQSHPDEFPEAATRGRIAAVGVAVAAGFYGVALGASYLWPKAPGADELRIPIAGPWMALASTGCPDHDPDCRTFVVVIRAVVTTLDGIAQAGGIGIAIESAFMPTRKREAAATDSRALHPSNPPKPRRVRAVPFTTGRDTVGISIVGRF